MPAQQSKVSQLVMKHPNCTALYGRGRQTENTGAAARSSAPSEDCGASPSASKYFVYCQARPPAKRRPREHITQPRAQECSPAAALLALPQPPWWPPKGEAASCSRIPPPSFTQVRFQHKLRLPRHQTLQALTGCGGLDANKELNFLTLVPSLNWNQREAVVAWNYQSQWIAALETLWSDWPFKTIKRSGNEHFFHNIPVPYSSIKREILPFESLSLTKPAWSQLSHTDTTDGLDRLHS